MKFIQDTYCPLCGAGTQLVEGTYDGKLWAFCANGATGPADAHTARVIGILEQRSRKRQAEEPAEEKAEAN